MHEYALFITSVAAPPSYAEFWTQALPHAHAAEAPPAAAAPLAAPSVATVFCQDTFERLHHHFSTYSVHLLTHLYYAHQNSYELLQYLRASPLPTNLPGYFTKLPAAYGALFGLGFDYVFIVDWDTFIHPLTALPLTTFTAEWPRAGLLVQAEQNMCAGVVVYRHLPSTARMLHEWWELGLTGLFERRVHDQAALKL